MDNYLVSARKYRPDTFSSVVGQSALTTTLKNAIRSKHLAQAYLFCGPRGVGKTTCARIFAKTINCMNPGPDGEACNECESCKSFNEQRSLNIFELDAASNNSVDGIRSLTEQVRIPPQLGKYKVYIIDEVHMLSPSAFNAFLKTLEEPPRHAIFILATTEKHKIIPTILSRCQIFDFNRLSVSDISAQLRFVANSEQIEADEDALNIIAVKSDGGMRDALSIFDQVVSFGNGKVKYKDTIDNLNVLDYDYYFRLTKNLLEGNYAEALLIFDDILNKGFDGQHFITGLGAHFRDLLVCKDPSTLVLLEVGDNIRNSYKSQAAECPSDFLLTSLKICNDCDLEYRESNNKRLLVELSLIEIAQLSESKKKIISAENSRQIEIKPLINANDVSAPSSVNAGAVTMQETENKPHIAEVHHEPSVSTQPDSEKTGSLSDYLSIPSIRPGKNAKSKKEIQTSVRKTSSEKMDSEFDEKDLMNAFEDFSGQIKEDIHLANGMKVCKPHMLDKCNFEVVVSNQVLQKKLEEIRPKLQSYLCSTLSNSNIRMTVRLDETEENTRPFTSRERLESMAKKNPELLEFYKTLGLELD